ncbi:uncharacterized protein LOC123908369 [Trifolium pratense]|uniref:Uncharacterized protein n=1 Tax=Trifolium pratense TaxID=57577 RepID=A0ACB0JZ20_TRIPR|nr:uncharacterized protein LOC123908369 [Trifolium pratense]CAJ2648805.1 unnamed protein product [Trifolium pratense]
MALKIRFFLTIFVVLVIVLPKISAHSSIQEVLRSYGLPAGLFPESIKSYSLDHNGVLEVKLDSPCIVKYETRVFFETVVRANLSFGQLKGLEGLSQEELFLWLPVKDIMVNDPSSGLIVIDIGLAYKQLSLSLFEVPPVCRSQGFVKNKAGRKSIGFEDQR